MNMLYLRFVLLSLVVAVLKTETGTSFVSFLEANFEDFSGFYCVLILERVEGLLFLSNGLIKSTNCLSEAGLIAHKC